jgi:Tol biopolymer transport system component/predicted Ser/Thr protein kinase
VEDAMTIEKTLGPYHVLEKLGEGGMGEVYRARDTRLGRDVALKVLPRVLLDDPQLRQRFEREAQTLAALNHPHIAVIHDVVESAGQRAIVMEFVAGRTLAQVIADGAIPPRTALGHAIEICDALAAAHAAGIVHRDLKPANVIVADAGGVKVLDFGIAKVGALEGDEASDRSTQAALTADRGLVGTIGYMSPEQVQGRPADARSDLFGVGVVLYEMVAGRRAFDADSAAGMLSAVLRDDPAPLATLVPGVPRSLERVISRCLQKDPRNRYQAAADLKIALEDARDDLGSLPGVAPAPESPLPLTSARTVVRRAFAPAAYLATGAAIAAAILIAGGAFRPASVLTPSYRPFVIEAASARWPAWSPDGSTLAYVADVNGQTQVFVRGVDASQPTQLTRAPMAVSSRPFWSPDGRRLYFVHGNDLVSVSVAGGEPQVAFHDPQGGLPFGRGSISRDGRTIVIGRGELGRSELWTIDTATGEARPLKREGIPSPLATISHIAFSPDGATLGMLTIASGGGAKGVWLIPWPDGPPRHVLADAPYHSTDQTFSWMPDSRRIVFNASPLRESANRLFMGNTATGAFLQLTAGTNQESSPSVSPDGARIAFVSSRSGLDLIEFPVDGGPPQPLVHSSRDESYPDISTSGALVYVTDAAGRPGVRLRVGRDSWSRTIGSERQDGREPADQIQEARLSPDGQRIAVGELAADHVIWIYQTAGGNAVRLDTESADQHGASWSPDGNWIAYRRLSQDRWALVKAPVGGGAIVRLADADAGGVASGGATDWSPTGAWIAHIRDDGVHLVSPDGASSRVLSGPRPVSIRFTRNGSRLLAVRRGADRRWELASWDVATAREQPAIALPLASSATVEGLALSPDESRILVGAGTPTSDIWLLEQFEPPSPRWSR